MRRGVSFVLTVSLLACCAGCPAVVDQSDFREFALERQVWLGVCLDPGDVYEARVEHTDSGIYVATVEVFEGAEYDAAVCENGEEDNGICVITRTVGPITLSDEQVGDLRDLFREIHVLQGIPLDCFLAVIDPCFFTEFVWDEFSIGQFYCESPRIHPDDAAGILAYLEALVDGQ